ETVSMVERDQRIILGVDQKDWGSYGPRSACHLAGASVTNRLIRACHQRMVKACVKQHLSSQECQARQRRNKDTQETYGATPSGCLLLKKLSDDQTCHLVQSRIRAISNDTRDGCVRRQQNRDRCPHRKSVDIHLVVHGFRL